MDKIVVDKLHLCLSEMIACRDILVHNNVVDELCAHLFGIYVCMRMDDFTKLVDKNIEKGNENRGYFDILKINYNQGFRSVRDKIGAHFQHANISPDKDMFARIDIYASLNFDGIVGLVNDARTLYEMICKQDGVSPNIDEVSLNTMSIILRHCERINKDDVAHLGVDAFAIGAKNMGFIISCSESQRKAQLLKSLELLTDAIKGFIDLKINDVLVERLFKRMYISTIINFYDNLVTRNISPASDQYDKAFDKYISDLSTKHQSKEELNGYFDKFHEQYKMTPKMEKLRNVRDKACAHLDLTLSVDDINSMLDTVAKESIDEYYSILKSFWNYLTNKVFLLKSVGLPARSPIFDGEILGVDGCKSFYNNDGTSTKKKKKDIVHLWRDLVKHTDDYEKSKASLSMMLKNPQSPSFNDITDHITTRLCTPNVSPAETHEICDLIYNAKRSFPDEILDFLLFIFSEFNYKRVAGHAYITLLYLLSIYAKDEESGAMNEIIDGLLAKGKFLEKLYACKMLLHYTIFSNKHFNNDSKKLDPRLTAFLKGVDNRIKKAAYMICLSSYWFLGDDYCGRQKEQPQITSYFANEVRVAVAQYLDYIKAEKELKGFCEGIINLNRFTQLTYILALKEKERNNDKNPYRILLRFQGLPWLINDAHEQMYQALSAELLGDNERALKYMAWIADKNPLDEKILQEYKDMKNRLM